MPRFLRVVCAASAVAALLAGCTAGPSSRPAIVGGGATQNEQAPSTPGATPLPPLEPSAGDRMSWQNCDAETKARLPGFHAPAGTHYECDRMPTRLDSPGLPTSETSRVGLLKVGSGKVPLVVLDDVDGDPGTLYAAKLAAKLPKELLQRFYLVGVDRRGTGSSGGADCVPPQDRAGILGNDTTNDNLDGLLRDERDAAQECQGALELRLSSLDSQHTAADLDQLRERLGVEHLNAIGRGEGARVLGVYANNFRAHVGRFTYDGFPDPTAEIKDRANTRAEAAESTFDAFAAQCEAEHCPLGADPRKTVTALVAKLRTHPLHAAGGAVNGGLATQALLAGLTDSSKWTELAKALAGAAKGDGAGLRPFLAPLLTASTTEGSRFDARMVTGCNDEAARVPPQQVAVLAKQWRGEHPLFGGAFAQGLLLCGPWPVSAHPVAKPNGDGLPPLVVLSTANDLVTPEAGTKRAAQLLDSGSLVSWAGSGHGALGQSECATTDVVKFLVDAQVPDNNTVCPA